MLFYKETRRNPTEVLILYYDPGLRPFELNFDFGSKSNFIFRIPIIRQPPFFYIRLTKTGIFCQCISF